MKWNRVNTQHTTLIGTIIIGPQTWEKWKEIESPRGAFCSPRGTFRKLNEPLGDSIFNRGAFCLVYYRCFLFTTPATMRSLASCDFVHSAYTMTLVCYLSTRVENQIAPRIPHFRVHQQHSNIVRFLCIQLQFKLRLFVQIWPTCRKYFQKSSNLTTKRVVRKDLFYATGSTSLPPPSQCCSCCHDANVYLALQ